MTTTLDMALIGAIVKSLKENGSWTGETHIQKACYIAKTTRNIPIGVDFILYKHGPYSFDLTKSLGHMFSRDVIQRDVHAGGYGPSYRVNEGFWLSLTRAVGAIFNPYRDELEFVCRELGPKNVAELERVATAVYVRLEQPEFRADRAAAGRRLIELKPHFSAQTAAEGFDESLVFLPL